MGVDRCPSAGAVDFISEIENDAEETLFIVKQLIDCLKQANPDLKPLSQPVEDTTQALQALQLNEPWPEASYRSSELVSKYLLPLLVNLGGIYEVLDTSALQGGYQQAEAGALATSSRRKAPPPPGLLSLRHYTDICALVEILVCTTILPSLPDNVLLSIQDRTRYHLPQSVLGRLSRSTLQRLYQEHKHQRSLGDDNGCHDLDLIVHVLGRFLLLDRFRPMLLPRHLTDLYAAILHLEHRGYKEVTTAIPSLLLRRLGIHQNPPNQDPCCTSVCVDTLSQAKTYQTLLRFGRNSPIWLRKGVSRRLNRLASQDMRAVLVVFVVAAPELSSAAQRLARALVGSDPVDCLLELVDQVADSMEAKEAQAVILTTWAVMAAKRDTLLYCVHQLSVSLDRLVPRLVVLWSIPPTGRTAYQLLFSRSLEGDCSLFGLVLREVSNHSVFYSPLKDGFPSFWRKIVENADSEAINILGIGLLQGLAWCPPDDTLCMETSTPNINAACRHSPFANSTQSLERKAAYVCQYLLDDPNGSLSFTFFRLLLLCYVADTLPLPYLNKMTPLVAIPILCDSQPMEAILLDCKRTGLFSIMNLVFCHAAKRFRPDSEESAGVVDNNLSLCFSDFAKLIDMSWPMNPAHSIEENGLCTSYDTADDELLTSIASILLGILVSILELGSTKRSESEEQELCDLIPPLTILSTASGGYDELSEVASHAVALLRSRDTNNSSDQTDSYNMNLFNQAKSDLASTEPPLRARGVATLRNIANASSTSEYSGQVKLDQLLETSIRALADSESYVYLAAIHTLVAIIAANPLVVLPPLSTCFLTGTFAMDSTTFHLSPEQRVKLTEVFCFVARRGVSVGNELPRLLDVLCFGPRDTSLTSSVDESSQRRIQTATHRYFIGEKAIEYQDPEESQYWDDANIRINTGGPLFVEEESDLVRSGRITVASELVAILSTVSLIPFVQLLIDCSIDVLRIERSRPIRRSGSSLAREIYRSALRDEDGRYIAAVVSSRHEVLIAVLKRCVSRDDLGDMEYEKMHDPATTARCQEALSIVEGAKLRFLIGMAVAEDHKQRDEGTSLRHFILNPTITSTASPIETVENLPDRIQADYAQE